MLSTSGLTFTYDHSELLSYPNLNAEATAPLLITGPSGVGKTTLLHLLGGLLRPVSGEIYIDGTNITKLSPTGLDLFRGKNIGVVFQKFNFLASANVFDNVRYRAYFSGIKISSNAIDELLKQLGIFEKKGQKVHRLSTGQQQRLAIAIALCTKPKLVLADEPTANLDDINCQTVVETLKKHAYEAGSCLVVITHDQRVKKSFNNIVSL